MMHEKLAADYFKRAEYAETFSISSLKKKIMRIL